MQRREVLRLLSTTAVAASMPFEMLQSLREARAQIGTAGPLRTLNPHQNAMITVLTERIIPATDTPGAQGVKVNEFIDLLLTEWYDKPDTDRFLQGIAQADADSKKRFGKDFVSCTPAQQTELMTTWDNGAMSYSQAVKASAKANTAAPPTNFFYTVKRLTLVGYYTSQIGFEKELGATIIPLKHAGCAPLSENRA